MVSQLLFRFSLVFSIGSLNYKRIILIMMYHTVSSQKIPKNKTSVNEHTVIAQNISDCCFYQVIIKKCPPVIALLKLERDMSGTRKETYFVILSDLEMVRFSASFGCSGSSCIRSLIICSSSLWSYICLPIFPGIGLFRIGRLLHRWPKCWTTRHRP